jgi:hypothetical protein
MGVAAVALLVPAAVLAPFVAQIGDRMSRERALALSYLAQGLAAGLTALALAADLPAVFVYAGAVVLIVAITATAADAPVCAPGAGRDSRHSSPRRTRSPAPSRGFAIFIGPLLAGVMIALEGDRGSSSRDGRRA